MSLRAFFIVMAIAGAIIPWIFFGSYVGAEGIDLGAFVNGLFATAPAGGFTADLVISSLVFWVWSYVDAQSRNVRYWWIVIPANLLVGLSLAMPLYFAMRLSAAPPLREQRS